MKNLSVSGRGLGFVAQFMATGDIRYYLNGVYIRPLPAEAGGGVLLAGCTGHILGVWHDPHGEASRTAIVQVSKGMAQACRAKPDRRLVLADGRLACVDHNGSEVFVQPNPNTKSQSAPAWEIEGKFPDIVRVMPDNPETGPLGAMNPIYMERVGKAFRSVQPNRRYWASVRMRQDDAKSAILVQSVDIPEALAVVMPIREGRDLQANWPGKLHGYENRQHEISALPTPGLQPSDAEPPQGFAKACTVKAAA